MAAFLHVYYVFLPPRGRFFLLWLRECCARQKEFRHLTAMSEMLYSTGLDYILNNYTTGGKAGKFNTQYCQFAMNVPAMF